MIKCMLTLYPITSKASKKHHSVTKAMTNDLSGITCTVLIQINHEIEGYGQHEISF
jgi:hypothetical protein